MCIRSLYVDKEPNHVRETTSVLVELGMTTYLMQNSTDSELKSLLKGFCIMPDSGCESANPVIDITPCAAHKLLQSPSIFQNSTSVNVALLGSW